MNGRKKITAVIGAYRKGGIIDQAVDQVLESAAEAGANVSKIYLLERRIEFCTNCRACMQQQGARPGQCIVEDEMNAVLDEIGKSDAIVLASPVNFGGVTAVMKRFMERLGRFAYWPWGKAAPAIRDKRRTRNAAVIASSAAPAVLTRLFTNVVGDLKKAAGLMGFDTIGTLLIGMASRSPRQGISVRDRRKARRLGKKLSG